MLIRLVVHGYHAWFIFFTQSIVIMILIDKSGFLLG